MVWRNTNTRGRKHKSAHYRKGVPDVLGVWHGKPLAVEVKTEVGVTSKEQIEFIAEFTTMGGIAFVAKSLEDVVKKLLREPVQASPQTGASQS